METLIYTKYDELDKINMWVNIIGFFSYFKFFKKN